MHFINANVSKLKRNVATNESLNSNTLNRIAELALQMYTILQKVLGHPLLMKGLTILVISKSANLNV